MATTFGEDALKGFQVALNDVEANLGFVLSAIRLRPRLNAIVQWDYMDADAKDLLQKFMEQKAVEPILLYRGMLISLSGAFEQFLREVVREIVTIVNRSAKTYNEVGHSMKMQNMIRTGKALATAGEPPDHLDIDYDDLCRNIGTCISGSEQFTLNAEAFTVFISNVTPGHLIDVLKRVGIETTQDDFGKAQSLKKVFATKDTRETAKATWDFLLKYVQRRNRISHTGSGGLAVSEVDVELAVRFFGAFAQRLIEIVGEKYSK